MRKIPKLKVRTVDFVRILVTIESFEVSGRTRIRQVWRMIRSKSSESILTLYFPMLIERQLFIEFVLIPLNHGYIISRMQFKLALVTGASAGIGEATARGLAKAGCNLILVARRKERLVALKKDLSRKVEVEVVPLDISNRKQVEGFLKSKSKLVSQIDLLVNNAGMAKGREPFQEGSIDNWNEMIEINVKGLLYLTRGIVPSMIKNDFGHIVNIGSVAGRWTYANGAVYCATKFAVRAISEGLRLDLMGSKIRVTNIEPGMVETEFSLVRFGDKEKAKAVYKGLTALTGQDIAETILWCVDRPPHVNIQEVVVFPTDQAGIANVHRRSTHD